MNLEDLEAIDYWILHIFNADDGLPIKSKSKAMILIFMVGQELGTDKFEFYPYVYGPYSTRCAGSLNKLKNKRLLKVGRIGKIYTFGISKSGKELIEKDKNFDLELDYEHLSYIKKNIREKSAKQTLKEIAKDHPAFISGMIFPPDIDTSP